MHRCIIHFIIMTRLTLTSLLGRASLESSLDQVGQRVTSEYSLGELLKIKPMFVGYEELNCLLITSSGRYVIKIFSKYKDKQTIDSNVKALIEFYKGGVPVPKLYKNTSGEYLYRLYDSTHTYVIVMDFFDGQKFTEISPTAQDMLNVIGILVQIHSLSFSTHANYDMWLTIHLPREFEDKKKYLVSQDLDLIQPVVNKISLIDFSQLSKSIVHFDLHRENVMKNKKGEYCILDLASVDYNYTIFDIGTFIALFCFDLIG